MVFILIKEEDCQVFVWVRNIGRQQNLRERHFSCRQSWRFVIYCFRYVWAAYLITVKYSIFL